MPDTDDTFVSDGGAPEPIVMPTVNASLNVWGVLLNVALNLIATTFNYTQGLITAIQAAATALAARVTIVEGFTPSGFAGVVSGKYYFGATCEGLETESVPALGLSDVVAVPFDHIGTFSSLMFSSYGIGIQYDFKVRDSGTDGLPGATLATATYTGVAGTHTISLSAPVTLRRPAWLTITALGAQPNTRGTTGQPPRRWVLGSTTSAPTTVSQVITCVTAINGVAPWTPASLGTNGWAPSLALVAS